MIYITFFKIKVQLIFIKIKTMMYVYIDKKFVSMLPKNIA